ncbi:uncharacterized protein LOC108667371 [Hyalella azteca]|uniref:Uncharacterized protein LOC108667371 n=1 Tax=Hyalella azteca TaxID=294128 RepID=A0A8B7N992_HYAAZ|nr:uncharacterized protein LOC108667371 [Hyalella azteca]
MSMAEPVFGDRIAPLQKSRFRRALTSHAQTPVFLPTVTRGPDSNSNLHRRFSSVELKFPPNATLARYGAPRMALPVEEPFPLELTEELLLHISGNRVKRDKSSMAFWQPRDKSCTILGVKYNLGEVVGVASDACMECRCAAGDLYCSPRCCFLPAPLAPNRLQVQQHEQNVLYQVSNLPPPHPLYNIRNQVMPGNAL